MKETARIVSAFGTPQIGGATPEEQAFLQRLVAVTPSPRQKAHETLEYYSFLHFGMNTMTNREWGTGDEPATLFAPATVDTDQWCRVLKESGSRGVILTAKHHDGFCLWDTKTTTHSVMHSPYGKDVLRQLRDSCDKYGLRLGVYLSPWDRNAACYGTEEYNDFFVAQLTELCSNYGDLFEVWFDGACGEGPNGKRQRYDWRRYYSVIRALQPDAVIAISGPDVRWIGNEGGRVRESEWSVVGAPAVLSDRVAAQSQQSETDLSFDRCEADLGSRDALQNETDLIWSPAEADVSVTTGWFYHGRGYYLFRKKRTAKQLVSIYFNTVGGNASLLLNVPPDKNGLLSNREQRTLRRVKQQIDAAFRTPLQPLLTLLSADGTAIDAQGLANGETVLFPAGAFVLRLSFDSAQPVRTLVLGEDTAYSQRVERFSVWAEDAHGDVRKQKSATVIGHKKILRFSRPVRTKTLYVVIEQARDVPALCLCKVWR
ncbi:MAG: alpha-L-fucosidase [Clostridia bacterium]|nr:alpha-L-fucosidase [Clostridia bacterium]